VIQCRARYEALKKGKAKAIEHADEGRSSKPPGGEGDEQGGPSRATRPTPRKRAPAKGKGKQPAAPFPTDDSTQVGGNATQIVPKRPRGRPRKATQTQADTSMTPGDGASGLVKMERPTPRKRGRPPRGKPSPVATDGPGAEDEQNT